jgi:methylated-DNA-[protein]-cysteine S-methyltransferase
MARSERGLRHLEYMDKKSLKRVIKRHAPEGGAEWVASLLELKPVVEQLDEYFYGLRKSFDLPLDLAGSEFQEAVWRSLLEIPYAATRTYGEVAKSIRKPGSARAVGLANNQNPVAIVVPCHRVIGAGGKLTGYGGGLPRKKWLLKHEERFAGVEPTADELFAATGGRAADRASR